MKSRIFFSLLALGSALFSVAAPLSPEEAISRVERVRSLHNPRLVDVINDDSGNPAIYHFTYSGNDGFLLVSADDAVAPLLGYSESNSFTAGDSSSHIRSWLSYYGGQISDARTLGLGEYREIGTRADEKRAIEPMITTRWDQGRPFYNKCPIVDGRRCVTGCVATAMAQVMNYWKYPSSGIGSITYLPTGFEENLSLDFSALTFDWDNMLDVYGPSYTTVTNNAVASLMQACGYSVNMNYGTSSSGARSDLIPRGLRTYFGYDQGVTYKKASDYQLTPDEWIDLVYNDLATVGPVIYSGQSTSGGHCFVCDGYDGKGFFHINWGWGGLSDGYFLLNELTPGQIGTGGHYGGYNLRQEVVLGIMPPVGRLSLVSTSIDNAADDTGNVSGWGKVYRIKEFSNIQLSVKLRISGGHVSSPLYVSVYENDPDTKANKAVVLETTFAQPLNASDGVVTCSTRVDMADFNPSSFYTLTIAYDLKGKKTTLDSIRLAASSGVDGVEAGEEVLGCEVYDMSGVPVASVTEETAVEGLPLNAGVYIVRTIMADGRTLVKKIMR